MVNERAIINDAPLRRRLEKYEKLLNKKTKRTVDNVARWGVFRIRYFMPLGPTGESRKSIWYLNTETTNGASAEITQQFLPHPDRTTTLDPGWFNVPLWMFESQQALTWPWKSGNIDLMRDVPRQIRDRYYKDIRTDLAEQWRLSK